MNGTVRVITVVVALWASLNLTGLLILVHICWKEGH